VSRAYDNNFWLKSLSVNGQAVNYGYDNDGLLIQAGTETLQRNVLNGLLTGTTLGAVSTSQDYNGFGEMETFTAARNEVDIFNTQFTRDAKGRITEKVEVIEGITTTYGYVYDDAGRLVEVTENGATVSQYTFDDNGNRLSRTSGGATISGTYDAQDRMTGYDGATYEYTANGELLRKIEGSQVTTYTYDVLGNLMAVDLPDGRMIEYLVDGNNRRIGKKIDSTLVQGFLYQDSLNPIAELDASGSVVSRFVYGSRANVPDYMVKGGVTYRIIADHLGSPRLVVDTATGDIIQRMDYDEFGNVLMDTNPGFQPFGFAGGLEDTDTGLVRFGARDYDPQTGRWTAKDPILFAGGDSNLFGYVQNNPVNFVDPSGLFLETFSIAAAGAAVSAFFPSDTQGAVVGAVAGAVIATAAGGGIGVTVAAAIGLGLIGDYVYPGPYQIPEEDLIKYERIESNLPAWLEYINGPKEREKPSPADC
jgi:RHS repeat-associated protein